MDLIVTVRLLAAPAPSPPGVDDQVLRVARSDPKATWRVVKDRTGLADANAKRADAGRKALTG